MDHLLSQSAPSPCQCHPLEALDRATTDVLLLIGFDVHFQAAAAGGVDETAVGTSFQGCLGQGAQHRASGDRTSQGKILWITIYKDFIGAKASMNSGWIFRVLRVSTCGISVEFPRHV